MYSSLDTIDLVSEAPGGLVLIQTDHRRRDEIEAEPEVSVLFALTRVIGPRQAMEQQKKAVADIVYAAVEEPPPFLVDALASVGASLEHEQRRRLGPSSEPTEAIVDRAFAGLAARARRRVGLTDPATALRVVEAETLATPPDLEEDEIGYWTRVLELVALTVEVIRTRHDGAWVITDRSDIPFGFQLAGGQIVLPANRARRFVADGAGETMFLMIGSLDEVGPHVQDGPILPSLRSREEATRESMLWTPLLEAESDGVPVIAYGNDSPMSFAILTSPAHDARLEEVRAAALANIREQAVDVDEVDGAPFAILSVSGTFFAAEKLLDPEFMRAQERRLDSELLAVGVPRRGLMLIASAMQPPEKLGGFMNVIAAEYERGASRSISPTLLLVQDGRVVGLARHGPPDPPAEPAEPDPPPKKPGFFRRLFGKK